jgi:hypothetical protein
MAVKRDLAAEQRAVGQFKGANSNKMPDLNNPQDRASVYRLAYPTSSGLPDELKGTVDEGLYAAGISKPATAPLGQTVATSDLGTLKSNVATAQAGVDATSQPNEALRVLQDAIRTKSGVMDQPLGTSKVFEAAGLTGIGSLNASLASQNQKFQDDNVNFQNTIKTMAGTYKDMAAAALAKYNNSYTQFKDESDRLQKIQDDINQHKDALETMNLQYQNSLKLEAYKNAHPDIGDIKTGAEAGYENVNGNWEKKGAKTITSPSGKSYDMSTYATDPKQAQAVQSYIDRIGKLNNITDIANYIHNNFPNSNINADNIADVAGKYNVGWEELMALVQHESVMGTSNVALKNNNYGGVTWSQAYQDSHPGTSKGTARPSSEGGYYVKFNDPALGLEAVAEQLARRQTATSTTGIQGGDVNSNAVNWATKNIKAAFGGNASNEDAKRLETFYKDMVSRGVTDEREILNKFLNFDIKPEYADIADSLRNVVTQNLPLGKTFKDFDAAGLANLINDGKLPEAIRKVENYVYSNAKITEKDNFLSEASVRATVNKSDELAKLVKDLEAAEGAPIGNIKGTLENWKGRFKNKKAVEIAGKITTLVANMRKDLSGSAVTPSEMKFLDPIIPMLGDSVENFLVKTEQLKTSPMQQLNSIRTTYGLPELDQNNLTDQKKREALYGVTSDNTGEPTGNVVSSGVSSSGHKFTITKE